MYGSLSLSALSLSLLSALSFLLPGLSPKSPPRSLLNTLLHTMLCERTTMRSSVGEEGLPTWKFRDESSNRKFQASLQKQRSPAHPPPICHDCATSLAALAALVGRDSTRSLLVTSRRSCLRGPMPSGVGGDEEPDQHNRPSRPAECAKLISQPRCAAQLQSLISRLRVAVHAANGHGNMAFTTKGLIDIGNWASCHGMGARQSC